MQTNFGSGQFFATPLTDSTGTAIVTPTPVQLGLVQDLTFDFSGDIKTLYGPNSFPVAQGVGKRKMSIKTSAAQINGRILNSLVFGQTLSTGLISAVVDTTGTAIPATPYTITPTPPSSGTFDADLGVVDTNGLPMVRVTGTPATGQYALSAGVYTFAAADTTKVVFINYRYTATVTGATKMNIKNQPMGYAPIIVGDFITIYQGNTFYIRVPQLISPALTFSTKLDDFLIPNFTFEGFSDAANNVLYISTSQ